MFMYLHRASWHSSADLTDVYPCFFPQLLGKCKGKTCKERTRHTLFKIFVLFLFCLFCAVLCIVWVCVCVCVCVLYYCHRVATQLQLTNVSYHKITGKVYTCTGIGALYRTYGTYGGGGGVEV